MRLSPEPVCWYYEMMSDSVQLKEKYTLAGCCAPQPDTPIVGYFSHDDHIKVHRSDCANLAKAERSRLVTLLWEDIIESASDEVAAPDVPLDEIDLAVLRHHREFGVDYSLKVARALNTDRGAVFESHRRLRAGGLLERVEPTMIEYRKGIVPNKWIKHRNHTYYRLTARGAGSLKAVEASHNAEGTDGVSE